MNPKNKETLKALAKAFHPDGEWDDDQDVLMVDGIIGAQFEQWCRPLAPWPETQVVMALLVYHHNGNRGWFYCIGGKPTVVGAHIASEQQ